MSPQAFTDERGSVHGVNPGTELGRYTVGTRIEEIRGGERWTARDTTLERDVSLLVMPPETDTTAAALDAARRAAGVEAPQLVRILDVGTEAQIAFIAEDGVSGSRTLAQTIGTDGLPAEEVRRITGEVATGVEAARARGLHHLALTPDCVLLTSDGRIKVRGLATTAALAGIETEGGEADREDATAVVALAYAGLTATWPLEARTGLPAASREGGHPPPPSRVAVGVPGDLDTICRETLVEGAGPESAGDYAAQIAPWSRIPLAGAVRTTGAATAAATPRRAEQDDGVTDEDDAGAGTATGHTGRTSPSSDDRLSPSAEETTEIPRRRDATGVVPTTGATGDRRDEPGEAEQAAAGDRSDHAPREGHEERSRTAAGTAAAAAGAVGTGGKVIGDRLGKAARSAGGRSREAIHDARLRREAIRADQRDRTSLGAAPVSAELESPAPLLPAESGSSPSRSQSNLVVMLMAAVVLVACVAGAFGASQIGQGSELGEIFAGDETRATSSSPTSETEGGGSEGGGEPFAVLNAAGYDPPPGDGAEHNAEVQRVYDGNPDTAWTTEGYETLDFGGVKDGVGITVDLGQSQEISSVDLDLPLATSSTVYVGDQPTSSGTSIGQVSDQSGQVELTADEPVQGQYVTVWFTGLAQADDGRYRASLGEITVR